ncbi:MAG: ATP-binding protein [Thermodesulfobacteriota bacterium]
MDVKKNPAFMNLVLSGISDGIYATDIDKNVTFWSKGAEAMTGHRAEDVLGKSCKYFLAHTDEYGAPLCDTPKCPLVYCEEQRKSMPVKYITAHKSDGKRMSVSVTASPLISDGNLLGVVEVFRNNTEHRELEKLKDGLSNMLVHDFKNHLSIITIVLQTLREKCDGSNDRYLSMAVSACMDLDRMAINLLEIASLEKGVELDAKAVSMAGIASAEADEVKARLELSGHGANVSCHIQDGIPDVLCDKYYMRRVVANLLDNAVKFTPDGGEIKVSCVRGTHPSDGSGAFVRVTVSDTGSGIPEKYHELIFDKYWQGADTKMSASKGVGLGLAFCKMTVEKHGGRIWVESVEGKGAAFHFTVPMA